MAQIKITITIEATLVAQAHAAVDAMNTQLAKDGGRVVRARFTKETDEGAIAAKYDWTPSETSFVSNDDAFEAVMRAMQSAEEIGGPTDAQYVSLMERIANETQRRALHMRNKITPREWEVQFYRNDEPHVGVTRYITACDAIDVRAQLLATESRPLTILKVAVRGGAL